MRLCVGLCATIVAGCGGCGGGAEGTAGTTNPSEGVAAPTGAPADTPPAELGAGGEPPPRPDLVVRGVPDGRGHVDIVVENHGRDAGGVGKTLVIEQVTHGGFTRLEGVVDTWVRRACGTPVEDCITLVPGAALHPPPWRGMTGEAQCDCEECGPAPDGTYRFVVTDCSGTHRYESEPFALTRE